MKSYEKEQEKLKRWYDKYHYWVYKRNCTVCGNEFYTNRESEFICHHGKCKVSRKTIQQGETKETYKT